MISITEEQLLDLIVAETDLPAPKPGDTDPTTLARITGMSRRNAQDVLNKRVDCGEMIRVQVRDISTGRARFSYRLVDNFTPKTYAFEVETGRFFNTEDAPAHYPRITEREQVAINGIPFVIGRITQTGVVLLPVRQEREDGNQ